MTVNRISKSMKRMLGLPILSLLLTCRLSEASMLGFQSLELNFKNREEIQRKARWSNPEKLSFSATGLKFDEEPAASVRFSLETTELFAAGFSWRPTRSVSISAQIFPHPKPFHLPNGQEVKPWLGNFFVRYSPDAKHWSSWQIMEVKQPDSSGSVLWGFQGKVSIPDKEQAPYNEKLYEYQRLDVPWGSDEKAAVEWILKKDPTFFDKNLPFIGYLQFLFETTLNGGQTIEKIKVDVTYAVGGMHMAPKDKRVYEGRDSTPWNFKSK